MVGYFGGAVVGDVADDCWGVVGVGGVGGVVKVGFGAGEGDAVEAVVAYAHSDDAGCGLVVVR